MYILYPTYVFRKADSAYIPLSEENRDYREYREWAETNTADEPPLPAKVIPKAVSPRQARLALHKLGKLSAVQAVIDSLPIEQKEMAQIEWDYSQEYTRSSPLLQLLAQSLQLSDSDLDDLFITAASM